MPGTFSTVKKQCSSVFTTACTSYECTTITKYILADFYCVYLGINDNNEIFKCIKYKNWLENM